MITLSERLQLELRNRDPCEITELILDNSKANEIEGLDGSYINLRELSLVNVGLTTLKGFPSLPNLEKLDLSDNKISTGLENLTKCSKLSQLLLTNNRIKNIKDIECLASFQQLEILDLFNCTVSSEENYRKEIFAIVPTLKYLDGFDEKNEEELNESEDYDEEEEVEMGTESNIKDVYELSDGSESDEEDDEEEYETEEGDLIKTNRTSGKAPNTGGKDMNLYPNEVVEISDEEELEENVDEYDEDEDYDEKAEEIIETNGKSKVNNTYMTESDEDDDNDDDDEDDNDDNDEEDEDEENDNDLMDETSLNGDQISLTNGIDKKDEDDTLPKSLKRKYDTVFNDCYDEDESCDIKSLRNNSDFELTDESSLLDKV